MAGGGMPQRGMNFMGQMNQGQMWPQQQMGMGPMAQGGMMGQPGMNLAMPQNRMGQGNTMQPRMLQPGMMGPGSMNMGGMMPQRMGSGMMPPGLGQTGMNMGMQPRMGQGNMMQPGMGQQGMGQWGMGQMGPMGMGQYGMGMMFTDAPYGSVGGMGEAFPGQSDPKDDTPLQTEGPDLLDMSPTRIYFKPGFERNIKKVMLVCLSLKGVAFKVQIHKSSLEFYRVTPVKGIVSKENPVEVSFELDAKHTEDALTRADPKCHRFHIQGMRWPPNVREFDADLWKQMESTKKDEMQTISVEVILDVQDANYKGKSGSSASAPTAEPCKDDIHVAINPAKLHFRKPYGKAQLAIVNLKSLGSTTGFKIQTNKPTLYLVNPSKGVIQAGKTESLEFEMKSSVTKEMLAAETGDHKFNIQTLVFPKSESRFDPETWKQLASKGDVIQTFTVMVAHNK